MKLAYVILSLSAVLALSACDQVNEQINKQKDNGKAIGAACRHSGRSLEDCYRRNGKTPKADIYAGWREMNEYMLTKKIEVVPPPPDEPMPVAQAEKTPAHGETAGVASSASAVLEKTSKTEKTEKPAKAAH